MTAPRPIDKDLWVIDDLMALPLGVRMPIRATVVRIAGGGLWVHSPTPLAPELAAALDALGPVGDLVAPSRLHHRWLSPWATRFPGARLWAAPGLAAKRPELSFAGVIGTGALPPWSGEIEALPLGGAPGLGEVVFFHRASRSLMCTDLLFNVRLPPNRMTALVLTVMGTRGRLAMSRAWRRFTRDRAALKASLDDMLGWDFARVIPAHGEVFEGQGGGDPRGETRAALAWALR